MGPHAIGGRMTAPRASSGMGMYGAERKVYQAETPIPAIQEPLPVEARLRADGRLQTDAEDDHPPEEG